jgi:ribosome-binding protein aMBF1 (putative translation factor)
MITNSDNEQKISDLFNDLLNPKTSAELVSLESRILMARFLHVIETVMEERGIKKKDLAKMINTSPSFITQLFRGTKIINLETLAKIKLALHFDFDISIKKSFDTKTTALSSPISTYNANFPIALVGEQPQKYTKSSGLKKK